jgi:hypothetical protein
MAITEREETIFAGYCQIIIEMLSKPKVEKSANGRRLLL